MIQADLELLSTTALLGTEKRDLADLSHILADLSSEERSIEANLLTQAFAASSFLKAATEPTEDARLLVKAAQVDKKVEMPKEAQLYLKQMLKGYNSRFLEDYLAAVVASGCRLPHFFLANLLDLAKNRPSIREPLKDCIDERGLWLCQQNPQWSFLNTKNPQEQFELGSFEERKQALRSLRKQDAESARLLLETVWTQENAKTRAELLACLAKGLSLKDEAFLEKALQDKSATVREEAADLLSSLAKSAYCARLTQKAKTLIDFQAASMLGLKKAKLNLTMPSLSEEENKQLVVPARLKDKSKKASLFAYIIARVPLSVWSEQADLIHFLEAAGKGQGDLLLGAWAQACLRFKDRLSAHKLVAYQPDYITVMTLAPLLDDDFKAELACQLLIKKPKLSHDHIVLKLLETAPFKWSDKLKEQFIKTLKETLTKDERYRLRNSLERLSAILPVELYDDLRSLAPEDREHALFTKYREFLTDIEFRQKMLSAVGH